MNDSRCEILQKSIKSLIDSTKYYESCICQVLEKIMEIKELSQTEKGNNILVWSRMLLEKKIPHVDDDIAFDLTRLVEMFSEEYMSRVHGSDSSSQSTTRKQCQMKHEYAFDETRNVPSIKNPSNPNMDESMQNSTNDLKNSELATKSDLKEGKQDVLDQKVNTIETENLTNIHCGGDSNARIAQLERALEQVKADCNMLIEVKLALQSQMALVQDENSTRQSLVEEVTRLRQDVAEGALLLEKNQFELNHWKSRIKSLEESSNEELQNILKAEKEERLRVLKENRVLAEQVENLELQVEDLYVKDQMKSSRRRKREQKNTSTNETKENLEATSVQASSDETGSDSWSSDMEQM